jgi:hypothetical protein
VRPGRDRPHAPRLGRGRARRGRPRDRLPGDGGDRGVPAAHRPDAVEDPRRDAGRLLRLHPRARARERLLGALREPVGPAPPVPRLRGAELRGRRVGTRGGGDARRGRAVSNRGKGTGTRRLATASPPWARSCRSPNRSFPRKRSW